MWTPLTNLRFGKVSNHLGRLAGDSVFWGTRVHFRHETEGDIKREGEDTVGCIYPGTGRVWKNENSRRLMQGGGTESKGIWEHVDRRGSMSERFRSWVVTLDNQDIMHEGISKLQGFQIIRPSSLLMDRGWSGEELRQCGGSEPWAGVIVLSRNPKTGEQTVIRIGSKVLTKCWNHPQSLVGPILYLVFLQQITPAVWLNCVGVEISILSSTGSCKSLSTEWGAEMHLIGKQRFELVSSQLSLLHAASSYSVR